MIIIWAVAVFGFQVLLLIFQKPTPEKALLTFDAVWEKVNSGFATPTENKDFVSAAAAVLGKSSLKKEKRSILSVLITKNMISLLDSTNREGLLNEIAAFKRSNENLSKSATDESYLLTKESIIQSKNEILNRIKSVYGLSPLSLEANILASNLIDFSDLQSNEQDVASVPGIMKLYLTHNQSFLTDHKFLGFPFHYFYTAEFLLILFVLLCLLYSMRIERLQKRFKIVE